MVFVNWCVMCCKKHGPDHYAHYTNYTPHILYLCYIFVLSTVNNGCVLHTSLNIFAYTKKKKANVTLWVYWIFHQTKNEEKRKTFQISLIQPIKWLNFKQIWFRDPMSHAVKGKTKIDIKNQIHLLMTDIYYNLFVWCILSFDCTVYIIKCSTISMPHVALLFIKIYRERYTNKTKHNNMFRCLDACG